MLKAPKALRTTVIALALLLSMALAGCSGTSSTGASSSTSSTSSTGASSSTSSTSSTGGTLQLANTLNAPSTYNPWGAGYGINYSLWWSQALYDSLVTLDEKGTPQPSLAKSWKEDGKKLTLNLRDDVKFTDGTPVDSAAVKANIDYAAAHPAGAECNNYLNGATASADTTSVVTITLPQPFPGLLQDLGQCAGFIVNPKSLKNDSSLTSTPGGSGPYTLDSANTLAGQKFTFVRNPKYWNKSAFPADKVVITQYATNTAAINAVQSGQSDLVSNLVNSDVKGIGSNVKVVAGQPNFFQGVWFIDTKGAVAKQLGDVRVRQAMNYAIDRKAINSALFGETGFAVASTPFAKFYQGYSNSLDDIYPYDVNKAKELLKEAGYPNGFSVGIVVSPPTSQIASAMAGQLAKVGITLKITSVSSNFISEMQTGKYPMVSGAYTLNAAQYQTIRGIVGPNGFWNPLHNSDPAVAALLDKISTAKASDTEPLYQQLASTIAQKALLLAPVISSQLKVYNPKKVTSQDTPGVGVPMLYNIKPVS